MAKGNGSFLSGRMKAVGRNLARVELQKSGKKFAAGGAVTGQKMADMGDYAGKGINGTMSGGGKARGGKASRGMNFRGSV